MTPEDLRRTFGFPTPAGYRPRFNVAPTEEQLALCESGSGTTLTRYRWGLIPFWADDVRIGSRLILARAETITTKPAFRASFTARRCLVIVDGFYEWKTTPGGRRPHLIRLAGREPFTLAGVWEKWNRGPDPIASCAIVTTGANSLMRPIHDRMPVIIEGRDRATWLSGESDEEELLGLLRPYRREDLVAYEVSTLVNNVRNDVPECLEPVAASMVPE